ncbi:MAG: hypothetical protein ACLFV7_11880 [Phycisphaerae bacterium]
MRASKTAVLCACLCLASLAAGGCGSSAAALELITVARRGLAGASEAEQQRYEQTREAIGRQVDALGRAFDADVRLVAVGRVTDADGNAVSLTPEWVIRARQGYTAGRDLLQREVLQQQAAHAVRMDNIAASDEALEMAGDILLRQASVGEKVRSMLKQVHRRWIDGE